MGEQITVKARSLGRRLLEAPVELRLGTFPSLILTQGVAALEKVGASGFGYLAFSLPELLSIFQTWKDAKCIDLRSYSERTFFVTAIPTLCV